MSSSHFPRVLAPLLVTACAHAPLHVSAVYSDNVVGDLEGLRCLATSLEVAGFDIEDSTAELLLARRADSPAFDGALGSTFVARAYLRGSQRTRLHLDVSIPEERQASHTAGSRETSRLWSLPAFRKRQQVAQARAVMKAEFQPILDRCALKAAMEPNPY